MEKQIKPELIVSSFQDKDVHSYIQRLNEIQSIFGPEQPIIVHIDSYGGSAYGFIMLYEHIMSLGNPIATYTSSKAMSAGALLLAMAGTPGMRFASPMATILIHEIQAGTGGDIKEMEQQMADVSTLNERIMTLFAKSIGLSKASEVRALIKANSVGHDLTLTAQKAKELKIIDNVGKVRLSDPHVRFNLMVMADAKTASDMNKVKAKKTKQAKAKAKPASKPKRK